VPTHAEAELRVSEQRFRTLFNASPSANYLIEPEDCAIADANERAAAELGYTLPE
jgi:PAS domain-containing protein